MLDITLTDLIDVDVLQKIQTGFSNYTGMAALTADANGNPVTQGSGFTPFCMDLVRKSEKGCTRCMQCDKEGALISLRNGGPAVYFCHSGLLDFAAPIMVEGEFIGSFIGGQVRTSALSEEMLRKTARELNLDVNAYLEAASRIPVISHEQVENAAQFLFEIAAILSEMAYSNYIALNQSKQLERETRSHNNFIIGMNTSMKSHVQDWIAAARELQQEHSPEKISSILSKLMSKGSEFISAIEETMEFAQMANGEIHLKETEYNLRDLLQKILDSLQAQAKEQNLILELFVSPDVPELLLGDMGRIQQIVTKLVLNSIHYTEHGGVLIRASIQKRSYATDTILEISDTGVGLPPEALARVKAYLRGELPYDEGESIGLTYILPLLKKMSATLDVHSRLGVGTTFILTIPQLELSENHPRTP